MREIHPSARSAELVGILLGDGSINKYPSPRYSTFYRVKISCHSAETKYISFVASLVKEVLGTKPRIHARKNEQTTEVVLFRKEVVESLLALGLKKSPKWERAAIPLPFLDPLLDIAVLRGYFDTDGSVVIADNNGTPYPRLEMKICPSPMQSQFLGILDRLGLSYGCYHLQKEEIRVQLNGKEALRRWFRMVGSHNPKHIRRAAAFVPGIGQKLR